MKGFKCIIVRTLRKDRGKMSVYDIIIFTVKQKSNKSYTYDA